MKTCFGGTALECRCAGELTQKQQMFPCPHSSLLQHWAHMHNSDRHLGLLCLLPRLTPCVQLPVTSLSFSMLSGHRLKTRGSRTMYRFVFLGQDPGDRTTLTSESLQSNTCQHRVHQPCKALWEKVKGVLRNFRSEVLDKMQPLLSPNVDRTLKLSDLGSHGYGD